MLIRQRIKKLKNNAKFLVTTVFVLSVMLLIVNSILFLVKYNRQVRLDEERAYSYNLTQLIGASDYLTNKVYKFMATGDTSYYDAYYKEINQTKRREEAVDNLINLKLIDKENKEIVLDVLNLSNELATIEREAFDLYKQGKQDNAITLIYNDKYQDYKDEIYRYYININEKVNESIDKQNKIVFLTFIVSFVVSVIATIGIILASSRLSLNYFKIEKESEIDLMTGLLNRKSYKKHIQKLIDNDPLKFGVLLFCDIDNLKFINDSYGLKNGDTYIISLGEKFKNIKTYPTVICRLAGDEFVLYVHGFEAEYQIKDFVNSTIGEILNSHFLTSLYVEEKFCFSTGASIYPKDSSNIDDLTRFSDYTMLKVKKRKKGEIAFYDKKEFDNSSHSTTNKEYLDRFLKEELFEIAFQPIVNANTFDIYGYEALMRPTCGYFKSPLQLLRVARENNKLDKVERLALRKALENINKNKNIFIDKKIFVNSIADRLLTKEEIELYQKEYPNSLENIIIDIQEDENLTEDNLKKKTNLFRNAGALIALDDYDTSSNIDFSLLTGVYDIIKIDLKTTRDIDNHLGRQEFVKNIVKMSKVNGFEVLAEGVETEAEVNALTKLGVHYLQGYFIGTPSVEVKEISDEAYNYIKKQFGK